MAEIGCAWGNKAIKGCVAKKRKREGRKKVNLQAFKGLTHII